MKRLALALALAQAGCIAAPFALPPTQVEVGTGWRDSGRGRDVPLDARVGLSPLGWSPEMMTRDVDFTAGYMYQWGRNRTIEGGWLDGGGRIASTRIGEHSVGRISAHAQIRLLAANDSTVLGRGAAFRMMAEIASFANGPFESSGSDGGAFGFAYGEGSAGIYGETSYADIGGTAIWTATAGLVFRLPIFAGVVWACCYFPGKK
ncbi:MAG TPA: hypothetical protein VIF62_36735 [Labilithrix sp.]